MKAQNPLQSGGTQENKITVSAGIDWISATYPFGYDSETWQSCVLPAEKNNGVPVRAMNGYTDAMKYPTGAISQRNEDRPDMGVHVTYSAKAIAMSMTEFDCTQEQLLKYLMRGAKITRLDVCFDVSHSAIDIAGLYSDAKSGKVKTRSKSIGFVESAKVGKEEGAQTMYIGSQKKRKKLLRVYDKGAQLGLEFDLKRFELECRGGIADNAAKTLKSTKFDEYGIVIAGMIKSFADFSGTNAGEFFDVPDVPIALPKYKKSDTASWLLNVVAKTLAKETFLDQDLIHEFMERFTVEYNDLCEEYAKTGGV